MPEMLELSDKDFEVAIIKILQGAVMNTLERDEKKERKEKKIPAKQWKT